MTTIIVASTALLTVEAAQVYSWVDDKGVTHYSQQPPRENNNAQFSLIDTVFSPAELKTIQDIKEQKKKLAEQKAKKKDQEIIRGCQDLHNEKIRYYRRKIEDTYIARLFVEPVLQNASIGSVLLEYAVKEHDADHLWALEKNAKAIRFYERHGFTATGEKKQEDGTSEYLVLLRKKV